MKTDILCQYAFKKPNEEWTSSLSQVGDIACPQDTNIEEWTSSFSQQVFGTGWIGWAELQSSGSSGGEITLSNKRSWSCIGEQHGSYTICYMLESVQEYFRWCCTGVYGLHTNPQRAKLWDELAVIIGPWNYQWVIGGDYNVCRYESACLSCTRRSKTMRGFSETIEDLCPIDMPLEGAAFI